MKKITLLALVLLLAGGVLWVVTQTPERRLCDRMGELCRTEGNYRDYDRCVESVEELQATFGEEPVAKAADCVDEASSCVEGIACIASASAGVAAEALDDFDKGFQRSRGE